MSIKINGKTKEGFFWEILAVLIAIFVLLLTGMMFLVIMLLISFPIWLPIVLVLLLK